MKKQTLITEVFWLRSLACLAVVLGHAIHSGHELYVEPTIYHSGLYLVNMAVFFGVPVFIFISEFILANKYLYELPKDFFIKRVKILLLPYIFMNIVFAILHVERWTLKAFTIRLVENILLGKTTVYFILIIFQFYILHVVLRKFLTKQSALFMIPVSFIISFIYLAFFNFIDPPEGKITAYIWETGYWLPFLGWCFYFVLGFYCGKYFEELLVIIRRKWLLIFPVLTFIIILIMNKYFQLPYHSKRVDMLLYSTSVIFLIIYLSTYFKKVPKPIMFISNYSFSIFLLNQFYFSILLYIKPPDFLNIFTYTLSVFIITLSLCIVTTYMLNQFHIGKYLVGKIMSFNLVNTNEAGKMLYKPVSANENIKIK